MKTWDLYTSNPEGLYHSIKTKSYDKLINFTKSEKDLISDLDRWLHVLKDMSKMDKLPAYLRKPIFERLFSIAEYSKLSKEERSMYDVSLKRKWDAESIRETAVFERERAKEEGRQQGRAEGERKKAIETALKLKKMGIAIADIAEGTGLSIEEIEKLK
ncbi:PD-(D/E)XK nuclease family transposase [Sphingobacterium olei]|uniref:PD-(D/E)XK nuclease family transposase n=1 Tax=Sphingobacterium olei TaxID=2571155 RepID=UPI001EE43D75|nr:PD-(D/E)XK nuclease family transposase [Sphingobacterium olei]